MARDDNLPDISRFPEYKAFAATMDAEKDLNRTAKATSKARTSKWRAKKTEEEKQLENQKRREKRANKNQEDKERENKKRREKRANLPRLELIELREKDRLRKEDQLEELKDGEPIEVVREKKKLHARKIRAKKSGDELEFDRIEGLLRMREYRSFNDGKAHLLYNLAYKIGMRHLREWGRARDYMKHAAKNTDEEELWYRYWNRGGECKNIMLIKRPEMVQKMKQRDENAKREKEERHRIEEERQRRETELDKKGRWVYNSCIGEYFWSIPDEKGRNMSLQQFNDECTADGDSDTVSMEKPQSNEDYEWNNGWAEYYRQEKEEKRIEHNRKQREKRKEKRNELNTPINLPRQEKGEYEKMRDNNIQDRYRAMLASGMFEEKELDRILKNIV